MRVTAGEKDRQMHECWDKWPERPKQYDPAIRAAYFAGYVAGEEMEAKNAQAEAEEEALTEAGRLLRYVAENGSEIVEPWSFVPCAREHEPNRVCILPDGHEVICQHTSIQPDDTFQDTGTCRDCGERAVYFYDNDRDEWTWLVTK